MKTHQTILLFLITLSLPAQSITFGPPSTLFNLDPAHWGLSQPMIPVVGADGKQMDFWGLTGSNYRRYSRMGTQYRASDFFLFGDFNYIIEARDYDNDGRIDVLTDADIFRQVGQLIFERRPFGNISYRVEGSLDYDADGWRDILVTERDFATSNTSLYLF